MGAIFARKLDVNIQYIQVVCGFKPIPQFTVFLNLFHPLEVIGVSTKKFPCQKDNYNIPLMETMFLEWEKSPHL